MSSIDADRIASLLSGRFALEIVATTVDLDGGRWPAIRPTSPESPHGFSILLGRAPRLATALYHPDTYAGALVRLLANADDDARQSCAAQIRAAESLGVFVRATLDDQSANSPDDVLRPWRTLALECERRRFDASDTGESMQVEVAAVALSILLSLLPVVEKTEDGVVGLPEGAMTQAFVNRYERSIVNRACCIARYGYRCSVCGFDFEQTYGATGKAYVEVHHITPVSVLGSDYRLNPLTDLVPLCANCHAMAHRRTPPYSVGELQEIMAGQRAL